MTVAERIVVSPPEAAEDRGNIGKALEMFPLAYALVVADMAASYFKEGSPDDNA